MKTKVLILSLMLFLGSSFTSMAAWIPAKLYCIKDGSVLTCSLEFSTGQGRLEATNVQTGEKLKGNYTAIFVSEIMGRGKATLIGDKGTIIFLSIEFSRGTVFVNPVAYGDGEDNYGVKYQLQTTIK